MSEIDFRVFAGPHPDNPAGAVEGDPEYKEVITIQPVDAEGKLKNVHVVTCNALASAFNYHTKAIGKDRTMEIYPTVPA